MLAISLHQPWASMIAAGIKKFETRAYPPPKSFEIGGWLAIHAAKKVLSDELRLWSRKHNLDPDVMPYGTIVCVARITGAYQTGSNGFVVDALDNSKFLSHSITIDEFGDYSPGRWAWLLEDVIVPEQPIPERGHQKFWQWEAARVGL
jgi:activating signal cointegrator 1